MSYPKGIQRFGNVRKVGTVRWLMRLGLLLAAMVLTAGCGTGSGEEPESLEPGHISPGTNPGTTPSGPDSDMPILFSAREQQGTDVTRGTGLEELNIHEFTVYGYKNKSNATQLVFPAYIVRWTQDSHSTTTTNTNDWEYVDQQPTSAEQQTIKYWDLAAQAYRFFGHTAGNVTVSSVSPNASTVTFSFVADADNPDVAPYFSKLWYSANVNDFGRPVQLEFMKPFVEVRFLFVSADPNVPLADLNITSPRFHPVASGKEIATKGTFKVIYPLTGTGTTETWAVSEVDDQSFLTALTYADVWTMVLPALNQGAYRLDVTVNGDPDKGCTVAAEYMDWLPGYSYTYAFKVSEEGGVTLGQVYTAYTDWNTNSNQEVDGTLYNW